MPRPTGANSSSETATSAARAGHAASRHVSSQRSRARCGYGRPIRAEIRRCRPYRAVTCRTHARPTSCCPDGFDAPAAGRGAARGQRGRRDRPLRARGPPASGGPAGPRRTPAARRLRGGDPVLLVPGLPGRRRHAGADGPRAARAGASAPTAPTSTPTSAARSTPPPSSRRGSSRSRSGAAPGCRSSATASAACSPAASPYAAPTWSPASSPWAARCSRPGAHHASLTAQRRRAGPAQPGRRARADVGGLRRRRLRAAELRRVPGAAAGRRRRSPRSTPGATASSTGGPASTRSRTPVEVTASHLGHGVRPAGHRRGRAALLRDRRAPQLVEVDRGESA